MLGIFSRFDTTYRLIKVDITNIRTTCMDIILFIASPPSSPALRCNPLGVQKRDLRARIISHTMNHPPESRQHKYPNQNDAVVVHCGYRDWQSSSYKSVSRVTLRAYCHSRKQKNTLNMMIKSTDRACTTNPAFPIQNGPGRTVLRPLKRWAAIGIAYDVVDRMMKLPARSKNAVLEPRGMAPSARLKMPWAVSQRQTWNTIHAYEYH
jgi:hypothetical protein